MTTVTSPLARVRAPKPAPATKPVSSLEKAAQAIYEDISAKFDAANAKPKIEAAIPAAESTTHGEAPEIATYEALVRVAAGLTDFAITVGFQALPKGGYGLATAIDQRSFYYKVDPKWSADKAVFEAEMERIADDSNAQRDKYLAEIKFYPVKGSGQLPGAGVRFGRDIHRDTIQAFWVGGFFTKKEASNG